MLSASTSAISQLVDMDNDDDDDVSWDLIAYLDSVQLFGGVQTQYGVFLEKTVERFAIFFSNGLGQTGLNDLPRGISLVNVLCWI